MKRSEVTVRSNASAERSRSRIGSNRSARGEFVLSCSRIDFESICGAAHDRHAATSEQDQSSELIDVGRLGITGRWCRAFLFPGATVCQEAL
jgi:hypothetical protein